jgi:hypothetical protein
MGTHRHRTRKRPRHARPAPWWPPVLLAGSAAAVIPGDTVGGLLLGITVLIVFTALAAARRVLGHAAVHVSLILAEELATPDTGSLSTRG